MRGLLRLPITEPNRVAEARRQSVAVARGLGFDETESGKVALVVTEAATNLVKHAAHGGELLVRTLQCGRVSGIEVLALDKGPGIASVGEALRNGYSTAGSPGTGLGAIARLSTSFDIHSVSGVGTAVLAQLWSASLPRKLPPRGLEIGAVILPHPGEEVCGDSWAVDQRAGRSLLLLADGRLLCTYGHRREPFGIRACWSEDGGRTWRMDQEIVLRDDLPHEDLGYPTTIEYEPGRLFCIYYAADADDVRGIYGTYVELG